MFPVFFAFMNDSNETQDTKFFADSDKPATAKASNSLAEKQTLIERNTTGEARNGKFVAGTVLASRYRIVGLLGKGGMGEVYRAEDLELSQTVALKFLPESFAKDKSALARFRGEVRTARQVAHGNVCRVFDIGEIEGSYYLSMEFIDGDDLSSLLRRIGRLPSDKGIEISRQLCAGLHAIHEAGILHRDLKPANVIIDSKGKARITDFGIAGIEEEIKGGEIRVGTPAYMSPEQITGKEVTAKSDIYSLGLLLYEIFTGKQALQFDSIPELIRKHQTTAPTNPSEILKEINPLVEKTILHCLEKNPADRPKNALQVALMLPGGNPLEAAMAAGETPSPEMVAAASKKGALKPPVALALLAGVIAAFVFVVYFSYPVKQHRWLPMEKSPEVLLERAKSITQKLGYTYPPADSAYGFEDDGSYPGYIKQKEKTEPPDSWVNAPNRWERLNTGQPDDIYFWYRQSPRYFSRFGATEVVYGELPSVETSGMVRMALDVRGRLMEFIAVPPQIEEGNLQKVQTNWAAVFTEASLDIRNYNPTESKWTPWTYSDERAAWEGFHVDHKDIPVLIEAAAYQGKPVYFKVTMPWDEPYRQQEDTLKITAPVLAGFAILAALIIFALIGGIFVARYNYKAGRADTKGAFKLLVYIFGVLLFSRLLEAHYSSSIFVLGVILECIQSALSLAVAACIGYLAIEPFVRKYWAHLNISWSRLMAGDFRDPLVGRDVLIGALFGLLHVITLYLSNFLARWLFGTAESIPAHVTMPFTGLHGIVSGFATAISLPILYMLLFLLLIVIFTIVFRKRWLAVSILWSFQFLVLGLTYNYNPPITWIANMLIAVIMTVSLMRFGMLAFFAYLIFFRLAWLLPLTTDVSAFYFNATVFSAVVIIGLAFYGFYTSIAGQPVFQGKFLSEENA